MVMIPASSDGGSDDAIKPASYCGSIAAAMIPSASSYGSSFSSSTMAAVMIHSSWNNGIVAVTRVA
jgi:hypothetical protein